MRSIELYVEIGFMMILLSVSFGAQAASSNVDMQDLAAQDAQMIEVEVAKFAAQSALPLFYEGNWQYFDHLVYYNLEGGPVAFAVVFQRQPEDTGGVLESTMTPTGVTGQLESMGAAMTQMREVVAALSDRIAQTEALSGLTSEEKASLTQESAEEKNEAQRALYGMDEFATIVTGASEGMPPIIKCYEGLPLAFVKKPDALALVHDQDPSGNWQTRQLIYLDRFTEAVEVVRTPRAGVRVLTNEDSMVVNLRTRGIERRSTLRQQFQEAGTKAQMLKSDADRNNAAQRNNRVWEMSKQRLRDALREGDQSGASPKEASLTTIRSLAVAPLQNANADSADEGIRVGAAGPDLRPVTEGQNLPPGWGGKPIVVYTLPATGPDDIQGATQVQAGAAVYIGFVVGNYGDSNAGSFDVQVWDETGSPPELILETRFVDGLQAGGSWTSWNRTWRFTTSGSRRLRLKVDPNHNVTETSETNNEWSDQVVYVQGSAAKKEITGVPAYINDQRIYDIVGYADDKGICAATSSAAVLGYWDRTSYEGITYSNLVTNIVAPLRDTKPPNPNVKDLVLAIGDYYYVDHASEKTSGITVSTVWCDAIRFVTNEVKGYEFDVQVYDIDNGQTNTQLFQKIRDEIDAGRPALWGVDSLQDKPDSGHAVPVIGYVDSITNANDSGFVHINLGEDPPRSEYLYWGGGDLWDFASDCVIAIKPGAKPADGPPSTTKDTLVLTFEGIATIQIAYIPQRYGGLSWSGSFCIYKPPAGATDGYVNGRRSGDYVAYNGGGNPVEFYGSPFDSVGAYPFDFVGAYLTAAHQQRLNITIGGYRSSTRIYSQTVTVNREGPTWIGLDYKGVDRVTFTPTPTTGLGYQFVMDDMVIERSPIPGNVTEYTSTDVPKDIMDDMSVFSKLVIADTDRIADIDVRLDITHSYDEDLSVYLRPPPSFGVPRIRLFGSMGSTENGFHSTILDDEAPKLISQGGAPFIGSYRPVEKLSPLYGGSIAGTWQLEIADEAGWDVGMLNSWSLIIKK